MTVNNEYEIEPGRHWEVDLFRPEDAINIAKLFLSVYGEKYPVKTFIDPEVLIKENKKGTVISSVAKIESGDVVGHNALFQSAPFKRIYETGAGVVHKNYRGGKGIFTEMVSHGYRVGTERFEMEGVFGESVCNHVFSQKMTRKLGNITTAIEVDLMPAAAYAKEKSASGRVASLLDFKTCIPKHHTVHIPEVYRELINFIYSEFDDQREIKISQKMLPDVQNTEFTVQYFGFAQVARIAVPKAGSDFGEVIVSEEKQVVDKGASVIQVWINMGEPWCGAAVDILRNNGYFTGGVLPRWFDTDGILMMKILHTPYFNDMKIHFDHAKTIKDFVQQDWQRSVGG